MDREVAQPKLEALRHCLQRVRDRKPATAAILASDEDAQDVLVLNQSRAVGFRSIAVHNYEVIDFDIVFALAGAPGFVFAGRVPIELAEERGNPALLAPGYGSAPHVAACQLKHPVSECDRLAASAPWNRGVGNLYALRQSRSGTVDEVR